MDNKIEILKKVKNPQLVAGIEELRKGNEKAFVTALLGAKFLCPANTQPIETTSPDGKIQKGVKINLYNLNANNGLKYLMAYTDYDEMMKWKNEETDQVVIFATPQYGAILDRPENDFAGFVINPFSDNIVIKKEYMMKIKENLHIVRKPIVLGGEEEKLLQDSECFPKGLVDGLRKYLEESGDVNRAYLIEMVKEEEQDYLLVVDTTENPRYLFPCIRNACEPFLGEKKMNIVPAGTELAKAAILGMPPLFVKKKK